MKMTELEALSGLYQVNFKWYEAKGLLQKEDRKTRYSDAYVQKALLIKKIRMLAISLEDTKKLLEGDAVLVDLIKDNYQLLKQEPAEHPLLKCAYEDILEKNLTIDSLNELVIDETQTEWKHLRNMVWNNDMSMGSAAFSGMSNSALSILGHTGDGVNLKR